MSDQVVALNAARAAFDQLRNDVNRFHFARATTYRALHGASPASVPPPILSRIVSSGRDKVKEQRAVEGLRDLMRLVKNGQEPTVQDLEAGPPNGDALGYFDLGTAALVTATGGAFALSSMFRELTSIEERLQKETGIVAPPRPRTGRLLSLGVILAGLGFAGWYGWKESGLRLTRKPRRAKKEPELPEPDDDEEEDAEDEEIGEEEDAPE